MAAAFPFFVFTGPFRGFVTEDREKDRGGEIVNDVSPCDVLTSTALSCRIGLRNWEIRIDGSGLFTGIIFFLIPSLNVIYSEFIFDSNDIDSLCQDNTL